MESHPDFLSYLAIVSGRSVGLALLTWLVLRVFRVRSASSRHAFWTVATAVMLLQVVVSPALPSVPIRVLAPIPDSILSVPPHLPLGPTPAVTDLHVQGRRFSWRQIIVAIYATVTIILLVRLVLGYVFTRRLVRRGRTIDELPLSPVARICESEWISVPITVGQMTPTILLPVGWREWDAAKLRAVLTHEEAHVRRADWAIGVMARINCCVFWFHPLAWWLKRELARLAEYACDDFVLTQVGDRQQYARALLEIAGLMKSAHGRLLVMSMAKETNVEKRMEQILDETRHIPPAFGRSGWITLLVCSLPLAYLASTVELARAQSRTAATVGEPIQQKAPAPVARVKKKPVQLIAQAKSAPRAPANTVPTPAASPYQKWLDEEAVYVISDDERRAFNRLTSDDERQKFVEQFWLRRDPTPASEENEFKEEHYRRIAFANDRFSTGIPGWKTDRGAIYIKYGPPDGLDAHGATPATYPYETWTYRYLEGMGTDVELEFVDPTMTGRYHWTKDPTEKETRR